MPVHAAASGTISTKPAWSVACYSAREEQQTCWDRGKTGAVFRFSSLVARPPGHLCSSGLHSREVVSHEIEILNLYSKYTEVKRILIKTCHLCSKFRSLERPHQHLNEGWVI